MKTVAHPTNIMVRPAIAAGALLLIPLIAMQFTDEVNWTLSDFIFAAVMLFGVGLGFAWISRHVTNADRRQLLWVILALGFMYLWAELAVGIFTTWGS